MRELLLSCTGKFPVRETKNRALDSLFTKQGSVAYVRKNDIPRACKDTPRRCVYSHAGFRRGKQRTPQEVTAACAVHLLLQGFWRSMKNPETGLCIITMLNMVLQR
jgi:hypothetical protein